MSEDSVISMGRVEGGVGAGVGKENLGARGAWWDMHNSVKKGRML